MYLIFILGCSPQTLAATEVLDENSDLLVDVRRRRGGDGGGDGGGNGGGEGGCRVGPLLLVSGGAPGEQLAYSPAE